MQWCYPSAVLCCAVLCRAATSVHLLPTRVDTHHWPRICCRHLAPLPASLACLPACRCGTRCLPPASMWEGPGQRHASGAAVHAGVRALLFQPSQPPLRYWPPVSVSMAPSQAAPTTSVAAARCCLLSPSAACSPSEKQAAAGSAYGTVLLWDIAKSAVAARLRDPRQHQPAVACAWCPLGLPLVSSDKGGGLTFWTAARGSGGGR